jgi:lysophospholipase L1-like esterase
MLTRSILSCLLLLAPTGSLLAANESNVTYLALGDSVAFGLDPTLFAHVPPFPPASSFTGYPEIVAQVEQLLQSKKEVNAACPGETSGSFLNVKAPDNGCNGNGPLGLPPYKTVIGLHTSYSTSQKDFAVSQLINNKHINLVTLGIGGNDLLLLQVKCSAAPSFTQCVIDGLNNVVLPSYGANLWNILSAIRLEANYQGTLVLMTSYSPSADPLFINAVAALNYVTTQQVAPHFGVKIADAFTAFQIASGPSGDPCAAGLLIRLSATACDVHPSPLGRDLLAATVLFAAQSGNFESNNKHQRNENSSEQGDQ